MCSLSMWLIIGFCPVDVICVHCLVQKEITCLNEMATSTHYGKELLQLMCVCGGGCLCVGVCSTVCGWMVGFRKSFRKEKSSKDIRKYFQPMECKPKRNRVVNLMDSRTNSLYSTEIALLWINKLLFYGLLTLWLFLFFSLCEQTQALEPNI